MKEKCDRVWELIEVRSHISEKVRFPLLNPKSLISKCDRSPNWIFPEVRLIMFLIREVVEQALATGCLTVEAEQQLRQLLKNKYGWQDLNAFITLQEATMNGLVKQESRQKLC